jgi:hypothetical protein
MVRDDCVGRVTLGASMFRVLHASPMTNAGLSVLLFFCRGWLAAAWMQVGARAVGVVGQRLERVGVTAHRPLVTAHLPP